MPLPRSLESNTLVRFSRALLPISLLASAAPAFAQTATPAVSTIVAFSASVPNGGIIVGTDGGLYGTTSSPSTVTGGLVFRAAANGSSVVTLYQMPRDLAYAPKAGLLLGSDGLLYGTTTLGGVAVTAYTTGTVFRLKTDGTAFTILHNFEPSSATNQDGNTVNLDGAYPATPLIEGTDGYLYGVTKAGGLNGTGVIFKISRDGTAFKVLHAFGPVTSEKSSGITANVNGAAPIGILVQWSDGYIYGTASAGGVAGRGTIFRIATDGTGFAVLHEFPAVSSGSPASNAEGATPLAGLTDGGDGRLYGVTSLGGTNGIGTIFAFDPASRLFTVLHDFDEDNGSQPAGAMILGQDTRLYGTTAYGGTTAKGDKSNYGTMFSIARDGTGFTKLHSFDSSQGSHPDGRLLQLNSTTIVGVATAAGKCGSGTLFQYSTTGATVVGNTNCGQKKNNGGGAIAPDFVLLLGILGFAGWRRRW